MVNDRWRISIACFLYDKRQMIYATMPYDSYIATVGDSHQNRWWQLCDNYARYLPPWLWITENLPLLDNQRQERPWRIAPKQIFPSKWISFLWFCVLRAEKKTLPGDCEATARYANKSNKRNVLPKTDRILSFFIFLKFVVTRNLKAVVYCAFYGYQIFIFRNISSTTEWDPDCPDCHTSF